MTHPMGGPVKPVYSVQPGELKENHGPYATEGGPAIPVYEYDATTIGDLPIEGGPSIPVRVLSDSDLQENGGVYALVGLPRPMPIYALAKTARPLQGGPAIPVYVVNAVTPPVSPYLFQDEFTTDQAGPLPANRTAEPGPGQWVLVQNDGNLSITGQTLAYPTQTTPVMGDQGGYTASTYARVAGRGLFANYRRNGTTQASMFGWFAITSLGYAGIASRAAFFASIISAASSAINIPGSTLTPFVANVWYSIAVILRPSGSFVLIKGGVYTKWSLVFVGVEGSSSNLRGGFSNQNASGNIDDVRIVDLPAPWNTQYGIATNYLSSVTSGNTTTSTADAWVTVDWTAAAGETVDLMVRRTDDNNCWIARCIKNSNIIRLIEKNAGIETVRSSAARTWNTGTTYTIVALMTGSGITLYTHVAGAFGSSVNTYASATFNQTQTGVKVQGGASLANLVCFPRDVDALVPSWV